jgi:hypothetical protein
MPRTSEVDFAALREGLKALPRTAYHDPGKAIARDEIVLVLGHRAALDPDRTLVVGNRGVGKSFWSHVLADPDTRKYVARTFRELAEVDVLMGFNASERVHPVAPTLPDVERAYQAVGEADAGAIWRAVLLRAAKEQGVDVPSDFSAEEFAVEVAWVRDHGAQVDRILTALDDRYAKQRKKLVLVFDALDRLGSGWQPKREQAKALLRQALASRSYRALRFKLFMRSDQFEDPLLFQFADGSKIANQRVELKWSSNDLYTLLFSLLGHQSTSGAAFERLIASKVGTADRNSEDAHKLLVKALAGEFMGATAKQGRVYTWLPLHLSDARGETSPRTFLTAWREAAHYQPAPASRALDHRGIHEGVRQASGDRVKELNEDYWWISLALEPLRRQQVPMERATLKRLWSSKETAIEILNKSVSQLPPVRLDSAKRQGDNLEDALIQDLATIGIVEVRSNDKINIPDIFRLEAGIKRKGGVAAPNRPRRE